jgi:uncharacterized protein YxjI
MTAATPAYTLELRQRMTLVKNRYTVVRIDPAGGEQQLASVEQKRFALKEKVTFHADTERAEVALTIEARNVLELKGTYDVRDGGGRRIATLTKQFGASLMRSSYRVSIGSIDSTLAERGKWRPLIRRIWGHVSPLPWFLPIAFDLTDAEGQVRFTIDRRIGRLRDQYVIRVFDPELDWRVAAACAVASDAFMNR